MAYPIGNFSLFISSRSVITSICNSFAAFFGVTLSLFIASYLVLFVLLCLSSLWIILFMFARLNFLGKKFADRDIQSRRQRFQSTDHSLMLFVVFKQNYGCSAYARHLS
ncbi:hypothetical protein 1013_scaffold1877_00013 [Bacteriophage sp.]|nr:hypothetical protein 1013_scaffold1877_00013 [Bacteriophage sp.]